MKKISIRITLGEPVDSRIEFPKLTFLSKNVKVLSCEILFKTMKKVVGKIVVGIWIRSFFFCEKYFQRLLYSGLKAGSGLSEIMVVKKGIIDNINKIRVIEIYRFHPKRFV